VILELLTLASLVRMDPAGDAYGAGDLVPPSAELYADLSSFDLLDVSAGDADGALEVRVRLAGIPDPGGLPNGLTLPVVDVYLDLADGGREAALPGVGMAFPEGRGWELALRLHGDRAYLVRSTDAAGMERPVAVARDGEVLTIATGLPAPEEIRDVQAVTGVYDPFTADGWRPLSATPSPWSFASATPAPPVIDLLAEDDDGQQRAIRTYLLPPSRDPRGPVGWLLAMFVGLGLAGAGLWLRRHVPPHAAATGPDAPVAHAPPLEPIDAGDLADGEADGEVGADDVEPDEVSVDAAVDAAAATAAGPDPDPDAADPDDAEPDDADLDDAEPDDAATVDATDRGSEDRAAEDDDGSRPPRA
jgi:hypothetical protein